MVVFFEHDEKPLEIYESPKWGFFLISEVLNGRIAMFAFPIIILIEILTKHSFLDSFYLRN